MSEASTVQRSTLEQAYRSLSLRKKLALIITSVAGAVTLASIIVSFLIEVGFFKSRLMDEYQTTAVMFATNLNAALVFEDELDAAEALSSLAQKENITNAVLYYSDGRALAYYRNKNIDTDAPFPRIDAPTGMDGRHITVNQPVIHEDEVIGNLVIEANLDELSGYLAARGWILLALLSAALLTATFLAYRLGSRVSLPITELANTAKRITEDHDVSTRQERLSDDETGQLVDAFNEMMTVIENRETALVEAKESAEASSRAKDDFLSVISHELRTPLNPIIGYVEILQRSITDEDNSKKLALVRQYSEHLQDIIDRVIDFSRFERGELVLNEEAVDYKKLCNNVVHLLENQAKEKGVQLTYAHKESEIFKDSTEQNIKIDRVKLQQVILNLIANAIKFTSNGSVHLSSELKLSPIHDAMLRIEVADTGIGIDEADAERIFLPFSQIDPSLTRQYSGMGLGLAITRRIVSAMRGTIDLQSEKGQGSTFWFEIPVTLTSETDPDPLDREFPTHSGSSKKRRVLLVDDQLVNLELGESMLASCGHEVITARSGKDAIEIAQKESFNLIILDIKMPKMNGYETAKELRKLENGRKRTPIIALTAHVTTKGSEECFEAGMDDFLSKPFNTERLNQIVRKWLD